MSSFHRLHTFGKLLPEGRYVKVPSFWLYRIMIENEEYKAIATRLIETLPEFTDIAEADVRIAYLSSEKEKKTAHKRILGECHKVEQLYQWIVPYDFMIILYEPNIAGFTENQIETLIRHELHHVGIEYADTGLKYYIVPHDIEEFWNIINDKGIDWSDM